jgi:dolichol kinase
MRDLRSELLRKALHILIALSPTLAKISRPFTIALVAAGVVFYICMEGLRRRGIHIPLISSVTEFASRPRDQGHFVLGPVTLGTGALLSLILFPPQTAAIAIYALAFGDGAAGLVGRVFGRIRPGFLCGKSVEGSVVCFVVVFAVAWFVCRGEDSAIHTALIAAIAAVPIEALPTKDWDNITIPIAVGCAVHFLA